MNQHSAPSPQSTGLTENCQRDVACLETLLAILKDGDFQSRWDAAKLIPSYGETAVAPLIELLQDEEADWELLWFVARILGNLDHPAAIDTLVSLLQTSDNSEIAAMVATALVNFGVAAVPTLTKLLAQPSTRLLAVQTLAQVREPVVIEPLLNMVDDSTPAVRAAAIQALSHFYGDAITAVLQTALQDVAVEVRRAAVVALGIQAEQMNSPALIEVLSPLLWDLNLEVCQQAAIALGRVGAEAVAVLAPVLQSAHTPAELQIEIVRALAWIGTDTALRQLQQFLDLSRTEMNVPQSVLGEEIIAVLGRVEAAEARQLAAEILLDLLHTSHPLAETPSGKQQIALSLGQIQNPEAIDALIQLLADPAVAVQLHALAALKQLQSQGAYERLQQLLRDSATNALLKASIETALQEWQVHADLNEP